MATDITTLVDKPAPVKPISAVSQALPNPVGGKILINDGRGTKPAEKGDQKPNPEAKKDDDGAVDLQSGLDALRERLGLKKKEEKKAESAKPDDSKPKPSDARPAADEKKAAAEEPEKGKVKKSRSQSSVTPEIVDAVAKSAAKAAVEASNLAKSSADASAAKKDDAVEGLSGQDRRDYEVFKWMEGQDEKYKGVSKQFLKFTKEFESYRDSWESAHPGEEFDPTSNDHDSFYAKNEPQYDPEDFENAKIEMRVENRLKERTKDMEEKYSSIEADVIEQKLMPEIGRKIGESVHEMVKAVDPEAAKLIMEKGSEAFADADPIGFEALDRAASELGAALTELEKLTHPSGKFKFNGSNQVHVWIDKFAGGLEREIKSLPMEDQIRDGKLFATVAEFKQVPDAQKSRYWYLDLPTIRGELVRYYSDSAKKLIESERRKLAAYQAKYAPKSDGGGPGKGSETPDKKTEKPNSPASIVDAGAASAAKVENNSGGTPISALVSRMFPS